VAGFPVIFDLLFKIISQLRIRTEQMGRSCTKPFFSLFIHFKIISKIMKHNRWMEDLCTKPYFFFSSLINKKIYKLKKKFYKTLLTLSVNEKTKEFEKCDFQWIPHIIFFEECSLGVSLGIIYLFINNNNNNNYYYFQFCEVGGLASSTRGLS